MNPIAALWSRLMPSRSKSLRLPDDSRGWIRLFDGPILGGWQRDLKLPSTDAAMRFEAVFACMTLIAQDIGKLRPKLIERQSSGIWSEIENDPVSALLVQPNPYQNRIKFFEYWIACKLSRGNAYALKQRNNGGQVTALHLLDPRRVTPLVSDYDGSVFYSLDTDWLAELPEQVTVPASEIIHDPMVTLFHPLCGVSPIYACAMAALQGLKILGNSVAFFGNMSQPGGILTTPGAISDETAKRLKDNWQSNFTGSRAGRVAVLGDGLKYEAMGVNAVDAQLIEQLKWSGETVCSVFHVPSFKVGMAPPPANTTVEALAQSYYGDCLQSLIGSLELSLSLGLDLPPSRLGIELDLDGLLRMDTAARYAAYSAAINGGWLAPNEARRREDLPPVAGGDTPYLQQQNFSLAALAARDSAGPAPATAAPVPKVFVASDEVTAMIERIERNGVDLTALKERLEQQRYLGAWKQGVYREGNSVTHGGSLWICRRDTNYKPGDGDSGWQLAVRKGSDGKDLRQLVSTGESP